MSNINNVYRDRTRYILQNDLLGSLIIDEPIGWQEDDKEYQRDETYFGVVTKFSNNLKFVGDAANYIQTIYKIQSVNAEIRLVKEIQNSKTNYWEEAYSGYLDIYTYEKETNPSVKISLKFNSGGLEKLLRARSNEQIEVDRLDTIDGQIIPELPTVNVNLEARRIFLKTKLSINQGENQIKTSDSTNGQTRGSTYPVPIQLKDSSHESAQSPIPGTVVGDNSWNRTGGGENGLMFFAISDRPRRLRVFFTLKFDTKFKNSEPPFFSSETSGFDDINFFRFWVRLAQYTNGSSYDSKLNRIIYTTDKYWDIQNKSFSFNFDEIIEINAGDSLALLFDQNMDGKNGHDAHLKIEITNIDSELFIEEDSFFEKTTTKSILNHELAERLVHICTGQKAFYSEFFGRKDLGYDNDGPGAFTSLTHGFWIRGFDKLPIPTEGPPKVENLFKPLTTSFNDFMTSNEAIWNVGMGIEIIGRKERVRIEDKRFFFNRNVTIRLPNQVKNVKRSVAANYFFSTVECGYEKGGDYEEACGLDEYNTRTTYTTCINKREVYSKKSIYRADSYGMEFARRKQKSLNNNEDTKYDLDNFYLDLFPDTSGSYKQRKWDSDLEKKPEGIFSPETAYNLRLSPFNCLLRHSWWFNSGLKAYPENFVKYSSSTGNSNLKTKLIDKNEYSENGRIQNVELENALFFPEWIEFEYECTDEIIQLIDGHSVILGKKIPNFYGLVEFINEDGEIERGYLFNLRPNGKGQWKLLKSNR